MGRSDFLTHSLYEIPKAKLHWHQSKQFYKQLKLPTSTHQDGPCLRLGTKPLGDDRSLVLLNLRFCPDQDILKRKG